MDKAHFQFKVVCEPCEMYTKTSILELVLQKKSSDFNDTEAHNLDFFIVNKIKVFYLES